MAAGQAPEGSQQALRGFGRIEKSAAKLGSLDVTTFTCENAERAAVLLHKFGRDMEQSATVKPRWMKAKIGGTEANVLVRDGLGSFLPAAIDGKVLILSSASTDNPATVFAQAGAMLKGARFFDPAFRYPVYLDKFSRYGIGSWYPTYWNERSIEGKPNSVDDHFKFARDNDLSLQPNAGAFLLRNLLPKLHEFDRPYHFAQWQEWGQDLARMAPEELVLPSEQFSAMPHYYGQISDGGRRLLDYRNWNYQKIVASLRDDPLLVDWLDPNGEVGPAHFFKYWDFSEGNRRNLVRYLETVRGYTLESLGQAWHGDRRHFASWDQVPIPMGYEFYGWHPGDPLADKTWRIHPATDVNFRVHPAGEGGANSMDERPWYAMQNDCPPAVLDGVRRGFARPDFDDSGWAAFDVPGGELSAIFWGTELTQYWYRGTVDVSADWLERARKKGRIYLTVVPLDSNRGWKNPDRLWVNGREVAALSGCPGEETVAQVDVTDGIQPGRNSLVYLPVSTAALGGGIAGPFFLTTRPMEIYPFSDSSLNARYRDWNDYVSWCAADKMENTYRAIRGADSDRFIKMMAAKDTHLGIPLAAKYGCFPHNTGEGSFFRPWDKRYGYPYGVPASAEFGGGIITVEGLKRWLGWFTFEGNNAFDNFHNIQEMMYSPAAPVWKEYMPYLKLAPRRDIKRPDIALFVSIHNEDLLPRPVPLCFDLGRGDLQSIGYSYVDVNESTIRDGLIKDYPVLWDTGTWIMDPETVRRIKAYVEAGGTFVALQETGRHTFTQRDAWPISELTGFKVREERPMEGTLSIDVEQPLFKRLAGRNFYNRGRSIDYSDYNYADKCFALEPVAADTIPIAHYSDGSIAIGMRRLGKGRVIVLGSPFWRDSYDGAGMWWPGENQNQFLEDLLDGIGVKPLAKSDSHDIWREHYLASNGTEEYLALFDPFKEPRTFSIEWTTVNPASALYDPKNGATIEGKIEGNVVKLEKITLAGLETLIVATQPIQPPARAVDAWFKQLSLWWRPSAPGEILKRPNLPVYTLSLADAMTGLVATGSEAVGIDPAALSRTAAPAGKWERWAGQSVEVFRNSPDPKRRIFLHCPVELPKSWKPGERIDLVISSYDRVKDVSGPVSAWLNGQQVVKQKDCSASGVQFLGDMEDGVVADVGKALNFNGSNALCLEVSPNGFVGEVKLRRRPSVAEEIAITGRFKTQVDADAGLGTATVPGSMKGLYGWKDDIAIPTGWKGSRVFVDIDVANVREFGAFAINDKVVFHPVQWMKPTTWMDITPWVKFGAPNRLTLISRQAVAEWKPGTVFYKSIKLQQVKSP